MIEPVSIFQITEEDLAIMGRAAEIYSPGGYTAADLLRMMGERKLSMYRAPHGLIFLQVISHPKRRELYIFALVGIKWTPKEAAETLADLQQIAKEEGCSSIGTHISNPKLARYCEKVLGFKPWATAMTMEVDDVAL